MQFLSYSKTLWLQDMLGMCLIFLKFINHVYVDYEYPIIPKPLESIVLLS